MIEMCGSRRSNRCRLFHVGDQLFGEIGSFHPFARTKSERIASGDSRLSIGERYAGREEYLSKIALVAKRLIEAGSCFHRTCRMLSIRGGTV